jgi:hypothetical protein
MIGLGRHTAGSLAALAIIGCGGQDAATLGAFTGHFSEFDPHVGVNFYLTVEVEGSGAEVARYVVRGISSEGRVDVTLPAILREGERYTARWFIDLNDNGVYDVRGDHGANHTFTGRGRGLMLHHEHHANRTWTE